MKRFRFYRNSFLILEANIFSRTENKKKLQQAAKPQCGHEFLTFQRNMLINSFSRAESFMPFSGVS